MKICHSSHCVFVCAERGEFTSKISIAMEWVITEGREVEFSYDGEVIGSLVYGGECLKFEDLPKEDNYGLVMFCKETNAYHICMPDEIVDTMPEE